MNEKRRTHLNNLFIATGGALFGIASTLMVLGFSPLTPTPKQVSKDINSLIGDIASLNSLKISVMQSAGIGHDDMPVASLSEITPERTHTRELLARWTAEDVAAQRFTKRASSLEGGARANALRLALRADAEIGQSANATLLSIVGLATSTLVEGGWINEPEIYMALNEEANRQRSETSSLITRTMAPAMATRCLVDWGSCVGPYELSSTMQRREEALSPATVVSATIGDRSHGLREFGIDTKLGLTHIRLRQ